VYSRPEEGIDRLRESNPFSDFSPDKAHKVFNRLFKHADEHQQRFSRPLPMKQDSYKEQRNSIQRSKSMHKIEHKMKNIEEILKLADSALKSSNDINKNDWLK